MNQLAPTGEIFKKHLAPEDDFARLVLKHGIKMKAAVAVQRKLLELTYQQLLKKYITGPLNMHSTQTELAISDTTSYTKGYNADGETMPHGNWNMFGGAAAILSDSHDMVHYVQANIDEARPAIRLSHQQTFSNEGFTLGLGSCFRYY